MEHDELYMKLVDFALTGRDVVIHCGDRVTISHAKLRYTDSFRTGNRVFDIIHPGLVGSFTADDVTESWIDTIVFAVVIS